MPKRQQLVQSRKLPMGTNGSSSQRENPTPGIPNYAFLLNSSVNESYKYKTTD